jgi:flagellar basal-body rod protein FlgB
MEIGTRMSEQLGRYLDLATSEIKLTAANMANIDTPGYKTAGLDFESEMKQALAGIDRGEPATRPRLQEVDGLIERPDGNNVSIDRESMHLAQAQLKFRVGVALLRLDNQKMLSAIHADK